MKRERGEGRVFLRGRVYWLQYGHRGRDYRESSKSTDRKVAIKLLRKRLAEIHSGRHAPAAEKVTLADLRELVLDDQHVNGRRATRTIHRSFRHLVDFFGEAARALDLTTDQLMRYTSSRLAEGAAAATVAQEMAAIRRGFRLAVRAGRLQQHPAVPMPKLNNARQGWATDAEVRALVQALPDYLRGPILFAYVTGWRLHSEVLTLRWAQVTADAIRLEPGSTKSNEGRTWPLQAHLELAAIIADQRAYTDAVQRRRGAVVPFVFHNDGRPIRDLRKAWRQACARVGLALIPHDLRRCAVMNLERAGVARSVAMKLIGHRSESVYRRYAIVAPHDLAAGVEKLATLHGAAPKQVAGSVLPLRAEG